MNSKQTKKNILVVATVLVWIAAIATSAGKFRLASKAPVNVTLSTKPASVRVTVNGEKQFDGAYIDTPREFKIPSGRNNVKISREGYISAVFTVDAAPSETINMTDIVLPKDTDLTFHSVEILTPEDEDPIYISLGNNFVSGETPIATSDTLAGSTHILSVFPNWPETEDYVRCRIRLPAVKSGNEESSFLKSNVHRVTVRRSVKKAGQLFFKGCEKLKPKS